MPSAFVQIVCDTNLTRYHESLIKQRATVSASSKVSEVACSYVRLQVKENAVSSSITIARPILSEGRLMEAEEGRKDRNGETADSQQVSTATGAAKGRRKGAMSSDEIAALFANEAKTEAKHYFLMLQAEFLLSVSTRMDDMFADILQMWADRPNASSASCVLEVCIVGKRKETVQGAVVNAILKVLTELRKTIENRQNNLKLSAPLCCPIDSFMVTCFDTEKEVSDRVLHIALYYSQLKDAKVRSEVHQGVKRKVDNTDMNRLYSTCLCEIPNVSERRAQVIASTFRTFGSLLEAVAKDDGTFEKALATSSEFGEKRVAGAGLAAAIKVALTTTYVPDAIDPNLANLRTAIRKAFGLESTQPGGTTNPAPSPNGSARKPSRPIVNLTSDEDDGEEESIRGSGPLFAITPVAGSSLPSVSMDSLSVSGVPSATLMSPVAVSVAPSGRARKTQKRSNGPLSEEEDDFSSFGLDSLGLGDSGGRQLGQKAARGQD